MLNKLTIQNFQIWEKAEFNFSPNVNVIKGESGEGKSSIVRSLHWLFYDEPSGDEFISEGNCTVSVQTGTHAVSRIKGNKINQYKVDGTEYNALRSTIPEDVGSILNVSKTNIQMQDDAYFMLSQNSGEVGRSLNKVVGLDVIDKSLKYTNSLVRQQQKQAEFIKKEIDKKEKQLVKYKGLDKIDQYYTIYLRLENEIKNYSDGIEQIDYLLFGLEKEDIIDQQLELLQTASNNLDKGHQFIEEINTLSNKIDKILKLQVQIHKYTSRIEKTVQNQETLQQELDKLENCVVQFNEIKSKHTSIQITTKHIVEYTNSINELDQEIRKLEQEFKELKDDIGICPFCGESFCKE